MKKISVLLLSLICTLSLCGCWDKHEIEDNTYAILLGIDKAENDDIIVSAAYPLTQTQGGSVDQGMDNGSGNYSIISIKAPTLVEALNMFSIKLSGPLALYSVKTIAISQKLAQGDMLRQVFSSWRYEEIRNTTNVLISECSAAEFIKARIKNTSIDPLRQEELLLEQTNGSAYYKPIQLLEFLSNLKSDSGGGVVMYGGTSANNEENSSGQDNKNQDDTEKKSGADIKAPVKAGYLPGEIPIDAENKSQISGLAVFRGANMVGVLNSLEAQAYSMLTKSKAEVILTLPDPLDPKYNIIVGILPAGKNTIHSKIRNEVAVFDIDVGLKCTIKCIESKTDYTLQENFIALREHIQKLCSEYMTNLIAKSQKEYEADILKLGDKLAYHFNTVSEWERYNWPEKYKDAEINLKVNLNVERSGIMMP